MSACPCSLEAVLTAQKVKVKHPLHRILLPVVEYCLRMLAEDLTNSRGTHAVPKAALSLRCCCRENLYAEDPVTLLGWVNVQQYKFFGKAHL